jgi:uncharacterized membrane protein
MKKVTSIEKCFISGKTFPVSELTSGRDIRKTILGLIQNDYPEFSENDFISTEELNHYRSLYLKNMILQETGKLNKLDEEVLDALHNQELISNQPDILDNNRSVGEKLADAVASFGGSWTFVIIFFCFLGVWMLINSVITNKPFDPYPFILLNLLLSCLAAIQAPIIMMSQNRKETKDRQRSEYDYQVNLKAELEIRLLHEKIDHLASDYSQKMLEIQQIQVEMLEDFWKKRDEKKETYKSDK